MPECRAYVPAAWDAIGRAIFSPQRTEFRDPTRIERQYSGEVPDLVPHRLTASIPRSDQPTMSRDRLQMGRAAPFLFAPERNQADSGNAVSQMIQAMPAINSIS
jgi:hypothetical protein